jgi:hypothetical protein
MNPETQNFEGGGEEDNARHEQAMATLFMHFLNTPLFLPQYFHFHSKSRTRV